MKDIKTCLSFFMVLLGPLLYSFSSELLIFMFFKEFSRNLSLWVAHSNHLRKRDTHVL